MSGAKSIIFAFAHFRESADPFVHPVGMKTVPPPGADLVRIGLMPHIPDQLVIRRVENIMDCDSEFDGAQAGTQMTGVLRGFFDQEFADLPAKLRKAFFRDLFKIFRRINF